MSYISTPVNGAKTIRLPFYRMGKHFILCTVASSILSSICCQPAEGAMPNWPGEYIKMAAFSETSRDKKSAIGALSGSPWPGTIDHLLQKTGDDNGAPSIHINYPSLGNQKIDADIRQWVEGLAHAFETHLDLKSFLPEEMEGQESGTSIPEIGPFLLDDDLYSEQSAKESAKQPNFELWGDYSITHPSRNATSITYEIWNYTGNPQGTLDILVLNYNLQNGQRLGLVDIFEDPDHALELMSAWARKELERKLGNVRRPMLELGTEPLMENFSSLTLVPDGIYINFQPLQVAPWEAGIQKVKMPLEELLPASPLLFLWGK